jgi:hypothetical protein
MGLKDQCKSLSKLVNANKLVFEWGETTTSKSNVLKTTELRVDVHRDFSRPGYAIAKIQVNKGAKDPGAKDFLRKGNKGSHKTTHKNLAEIRFSQVEFNEEDFKRQIADAWKFARTESSQGETGESSGGGWQAGDGQAGDGHAAGGAAGGAVGGGERVWEWDSQEKTNKYWDGAKWVYWDVAYAQEKYWDGTSWQWNL